MKNKQNKFYITTAIPYVNADPHIGHALEFVQTDVIARYHQQKGEDVYFLTGADENSLKNVQSAEKAGISVQDFVNQGSQKLIDLTRAYNISNNDFIKTSAEFHKKAVQKLWNACQKEDIYKKHYKGYYCVGCEAFVTEKDLVDGKCPEHQTEPEIVEEENYFFKLSNYQDKLYKLIESNEYQVIPQTRKNEVLSFIKMGLEDFSISRSVERAHNWGVVVPDDDSQIMYVWYDALSNYITGLDYLNEGELYQKYWPADLHVIGKGISRFHAIYWPAMLMSAGLLLPKKLFVHGYVNIKGEKMSKSLGNAIDPLKLVNKYGTDPIRYYLLRYIHPFEDSDFSIEHLEGVYNSDLANGIGNLVSRTANMIEKNKLNIKVKKLDFIENELVEEYKFHEALKEINDLATDIDQLIDREKPWALVTSDRSKAEEVLQEAVDKILIMANKLECFLPETVEKIKNIFTTKKIKKPSEPLFPRLNK